MRPPPAAAWKSRSPIPASAFPPRTSTASSIVSGKATDRRAPASDLDWRFAKGSATPMAAVLGDQRTRTRHDLLFRNPSRRGVIAPRIAESVAATRISWPQAGPARAFPRDAVASVWEVVQNRINGPVFFRTSGFHPPQQRRVSGHRHPPMLFAHGFGCDQNMWRFVAPAFEHAHRIVLFDHVGAGSPTPPPTIARSTRRSTAMPPTPGDLSRTPALGRHLRRPLGERIIGVLAANREPHRFGRSSWSAPRRATSTTAITSAAFHGRTSKGCSIRSTATISAGRARWRRSSWAIRIVRSWATS